MTLADETGLPGYTPEMDTPRRRASDLDSDLDPLTVRECLRAIAGSLASIEERAAAREVQIESLRGEIRALTEASRIEAATTRAVHDASPWAAFLAAPASTKAAIFALAAALFGGGAGVHDVLLTLARAVAGVP